MKVFIDTNLVLDVLAQREPFFDESKRVWELIEKGEVTGYLSATSLTDIFYILKKHLGQNGAYASLSKLMLVFRAVSVSEADVRKALRLGLSDFEDALQLVYSRKLNIDYLVTRNTKDYPPSADEVIAPAEFLGKWQSGWPFDEDQNK